MITVEAITPPTSQNDEKVAEEMIKAFEAADEELDKELHKCAELQAKSIAAAKQAYDYDIY